MFNFFNGIAVFGGLIALIYFFSVAFFTAWLARQKRRSGILWFFLGLFFNVIALISVGLS